MSLSTNETITIVGWVVIPVLTAILTYFQQKKTQKEINNATIKRENEKELDNLLKKLEDDSREFWFSKGSSDKSKILSIKIKGQLRDLETKLSDTHLIKLRQEITDGNDFDNPKRNQLPETHRKFNEISTVIIKIRNEIK